MSQLELKKQTILAQITGLCAHCQSASKIPHRCPVASIRQQILSLNGVPLIVNNQFRGILAN